MGIPYFIPSLEFLKMLISLGNYFDSGMSCDDLFDLSEWYNPANAPFFIYFDSRADLKEKIAQTDFWAHREKLKKHLSQHTQSTLEKWRALLL